MWITDTGTKPCPSLRFLMAVNGGRGRSVSQSSDGQSVHPYLAAALRVRAVPSRLFFVAAATVAFSTFFLRAAAVGAAFFVEAFVDAFAEAFVVEVFAAVPAPRLALVLFLSAGASCRSVGQSMRRGCDGLVTWIDRSRDEARGRRSIT